jgi:deazaflavin-dependent oxidoreductase (nitroreductase family)
MPAPRGCARKDGDMTSWNDNVITQFRESKGVTNHWGPKLVVMHTVGAKSGEERLAPVVGFIRDGGWQVVASKGGTPENPAWYHNLLAHPSFDIEAIEDGEIVTVPVTATEIPADDWQATYDSIAAEEPQFGEYLTKTDRRIPVFQLTRA